MFFAIFLGTTVTILALWMEVSHWRTWQKAAGSKLEKQERNFLWKQCRRRLQASAMLGVIGIAIVCSIFLQDHLVTLCYWLGVLLLLFWVVMLAIGDIVHTRSFYGRIQRREEAQRDALQAELLSGQSGETDEKNGSDNGG